jgi:copper(I)-binding protein
MKRLAACSALVVIVLAACGSDGGITIEDAWARTSAAGQTTGAIYFQLTSDDDDRLLAASVPETVAGEAEVHEVVMVADDGSMDDTDDGSMDDTDDGSMDDNDDGSMDDTDDGSMDDTDDGSMDDMDDEMDMSGQMRMQELTDGLALPAGETVTFEPGGYHIMLLDLVEPLEVGDTIELTLDFETADDETITVEVAESAP